MSHWDDICSFKEALVSSDIGGQIAKVVWFGSTIKGEARPESDVDLLIITANGEEIRGRISDLVLDFQVGTGCPVEIVTSSIEEMYPVTDHFLANVIAYGREVYSMPEEELRRSAAGHYLLLAQEYHDSAMDSIQRGHLRLGLDGAYNSAELAVKGLLLLKIADLPGSHGGVVQRFGELYIKTGELERAFGRRMNQCLEMRNAARYKHTARVTVEEATHVLEMARDLIASLEDRLQPK